MEFVIDSSKSCFNTLSSSHSYQTIKTLFAALSSIDIYHVLILWWQQEMILLLYVVKFHAKDSFSDMYNEEQESRNASGELT